MQVPVTVGCFDIYPLLMAMWCWLSYNHKFALVCFVLQALVEHCSASGMPEAVERCVLHLDIASLDIHQVSVTNQSIHYLDMASLAVPQARMPVYSDVCCTWTWYLGLCL